MAVNEPAILMLEDNRGDAVLFQEALRERGNRVRLVVARTVEEGTKTLSRLVSEGDAPCLILVDLHMPRQDGRAFLDFAGTDERFARIPTIMLTSSQREFDREECLRLGADSFLVKPSDWTSYLKLVDSFKSYWTPAT